MLFVSSVVLSAEATTVFTLSPKAFLRTESISELGSTAVTLHGFLSSADVKMPVPAPISATASAFVIS